MIALLLVRQAGRLLANLLVMGGTVVGRAVVQAYRQAIVSECSALLSPPSPPPPMLSVKVACLDCT